MPNDDARPEWDDVDSTAEQTTDYLDNVTGVDAIQEYKRRSHRLLHPSPGDRILDVGCGAGDDVLMLAEQVRPEGVVIGLDKSESLITEARACAGKTTGVRFEVGDVMQLAFAENDVDACRADRVFQHLADPRGALAEMHRVTRPGGAFRSLTRTGTRVSSLRLVSKTKSAGRSLTGDGLILGTQRSATASIHWFGKLDSRTSKSTQSRSCLLISKQQTKCSTLWIGSK